MILQGFEQITSYFDTMLNHQLTQKFKLMGYEKFNYNNILTDE